MRQIFSTELGNEHEDKLRKDATEWHDRHLDKAGLPRERRVAEVAVGDPATEIIAAVRRFGIDLVVLPTRGSGGGGDAVIGSVARSVLRGANAPIRVVNRTD